MCANYNKLYIFEKLLTRQIQISLQYFHKLNLYSRKTENVQIFFKGTREKIYAKFLRKYCAIFFLLFKAFQKAIQSGSLHEDTGSRYKSPALPCWSCFIDLFYYWSCFIGLLHCWSCFIDLFYYWSFFIDLIYCWSCFIDLFYYWSFS